MMTEILEIHQAVHRIEDQLKELRADIEKIAAKIDQAQPAKKLPPPDSSTDWA